MRKALARIFAILAIGACAGASYAVIHANFDKDDTSTAAKAPAKAKALIKKSSRQYYVVKSGDTLSEIAHKNDIPVLKIKLLNKKLDDHVLQPGQKVRLR